MVLVVSFVALAILWPEPRLERERWKPLPGEIGRLLGSRVIEVLCGAIGVFLLAVVVYAGLRGADIPEANFASLFVYIAFWVGLVPVSVLFGDVFRAFNPWRALGRAAAWLARTVSRGDLPEPLDYPERLGRWPAAIGLFAFTALELVAADGDQPDSVAIAALVYTGITFVGMALYGVDRWTERGEAFSVYFNLFSRLSPFETRDREVVLRKPLSGLPRLELLPGTVAVLAVMIGTVTFDGGSEAPLWNNISPDIAQFFQDLGLSPKRAFEAAFLLGLTGAVLFIGGFYRLGIAGAKSVGGGFSARRLAHEFIYSLVPIALAYVMAHYFTLLILDGQRLFYAISDPLGQGNADIFGTAGSQPDFRIIGANAIWYTQVGFVVAGHVAALVLAHDRAIALYRDAKLAVRSQYWMLAIMVGFTSLALWLLSQANA
jgi:hypothetical protein